MSGILDEVITSHGEDDAAAALLEKFDLNHAPEETEGGAEEDAGPPKVYFLGFIHETGLRKELIPIKAFASNHIGQDRARWQEAVPKGLKTHRALYCKNGDATIVLEAWRRMYEGKAVKKGSSWFTVSKKNVEEFTDRLAATDDYALVTEAKAKLKTSRKK
jgi:hypothetical protein